MCNRCHDLLVMSVNLSDIGILNIKGFDYRCIINLIIKDEAIKLLLVANLTGESRILYNIKIGLHI